MIVGIYNSTAKQPTISRIDNQQAQYKIYCQWWLAVQTSAHVQDWFILNTMIAICEPSHGMLQKQNIIRSVIHESSKDLCISASVVCSELQC